MQLTLEFESRAPAIDRPRLSRQCVRIIERLQRGPATNIELASMALKYTSRLSECKAAGFVIMAKRIDGGLWKYSLMEEPCISGNGRVTDHSPISSPAAARGQ